VRSRTDDRITIKQLEDDLMILMDNHCFDDLVAAFQRIIIKQALFECRGENAAAGRMLGLKRTTLLERRRKLAIYKAVNKFGYGYRVDCNPHFRKVYGRKCLLCNNVFEGNFLQKCTKCGNANKKKIKIIYRIGEDGK
jgi:DNA-binding protein Fis